MRPREDQTALLRRVKGAKVPYTYKPLRKNTPDLVQASTPLFPDRVVTPWPVVARKILKASEHLREAVENLRLAKLVYQLATLSCEHVSSIDVDGLKLGLDRNLKDIGGRLTFWSPYVFFDGERPFVPYFEFRRKGGSEGRAAQLFVHSMMHHSIREADPDLADIDVAIAYMPGGKVRRLELLRPRSEKFLTVDELQDRVEHTYKLWFEVLAEREQAKRAAG